MINKRIVMALRLDTCPLLCSVSSGLDALIKYICKPGICSVFIQLIYWSPAPGFLTQSAKIEAILYDIGRGHFLPLGNKERLILGVTLSS